MIYIKYIVKFLLSINPLYLNNLMRNMDFLLIFVFRLNLLGLLNYFFDKIHVRYSFNFVCLFVRELAFCKKYEKSS